MNFSACHLTAPALMTALPQRARMWGAKRSACEALQSLLRCHGNCSEWQSRSGSGDVGKKATELSRVQRVGGFANAAMRFKPELINAGEGSRCSARSCRTLLTSSSTALREVWLSRERKTCHADVSFWILLVFGRLKVVDKWKTRQDERGGNNGAGGGRVPLTFKTKELCAGVSAKSEDGFWWQRGGGLDISNGSKALGIRQGGGKT